MAFRLEQPLQLWRVGHSAFPLWTGMGAAMRGGRWNSAGLRVVYASAHYSLSLLEVLANLTSKSIPPSFVRSSLTIANGASAERIPVNAVPGWDTPSHPAATRYGDQWLRESRSLLLFVPSAVVEGIEENVLVNPQHPEFESANATDPAPIDWDLRLFA